MQRSFDKDEFARLTQLPFDEIDELVDAGLLDLDEDGLFDDYDALRLSLVSAFREEGLDVDEIAKRLGEGTLEIPFIGHYLFRTKSTARSLEETSELVGMSPKKLQELRTAVGLGGPAHFDDADIEAFRAAKVVTDWGMPWEGIIEVARVYGDAFRRIAQTEVRLLNSYVAEPLAEAGAGIAEVSVQLRSVLQAIYPVMSPLLDFFHRQYIAREAARMTMISLQRTERPAARGSMDVAIVFVDLTSFTTLAQIHGDETAADVLDQLDHLVRSLVLKHNGSLVKQIGDAFMLAFEDPADAVRFSIALGEAAEKHEHFLATRTGIHFGSVLYRVGDYVGNTVNIASRLAAEAMPNEVLVTEAVAEAASRAGIEVSQAGVRMLRGSAEPLSLHRVVRPTAGDLKQDPVCGMMVDDESAAARLMRDGQEVLFCSEDCLRRFLEKPELYAVASSG